MKKNYYGESQTVRREEKEAEEFTKSEEYHTVRMKEKEAEAIKRSEESQTASMEDMNYGEECLNRNALSELMWRVLCVRHL